MKNDNNPLWGEGEKKSFGKVAIDYAAEKDIREDQLFVQYECLTNQAFQLMLFKKGILPKIHAQKIIAVLDEVKKLDNQGKFILKKELEDVHSNVEKYVIDKLGVEIGGNLRLGIARNDQIYTDTRMFLRDKLIIIIGQVTDLVEELIKVAKVHTDTIMPGYTHLRISQPITYSHWLTAKCYHFLDDAQNIFYDLSQVNASPLGIFEFAGTQLPIDRDMIAKFLGFESVLRNSLYAANTRGEIEAKILADFSILALHMKRTMQELILWSTHEFGLVEIDDLYTTGGTAQPNLKNPDTLEVIRANCPKIYSKFFQIITIMDSLTSGYYRDTQETKSAIVEATGVVESTLPVFSGIISSLKINKQKMATLADINFSTAPDFTNQIATKGKISFREAYKIVKYIIKEKYVIKSLSEITPEMIMKVSLKLLNKKVAIKQEDIDAVSTAKKRVYSIKSKGGPQPAEVTNMIKELTKNVEAIKQKTNKKKLHIKKAIEKLEHDINII